MEVGVRGGCGDGVGVGVEGRGRFWGGEVGGEVVAEIVRLVVMVKFNGWVKARCVRSIATRINFSLRFMQGG